jgi:hypothetical protein
MNCLPELASKDNSPNLSLPSNQDYRREPLAPGHKFHLFDDNEMTKNSLEEKKRRIQGDTGK